MNTQEEPPASVDRSETSSDEQGVKIEKERKEKRRMQAKRKRDAERERLDRLAALCEGVIPEEKNDKTRKIVIENAITTLKKLISERIAHPLSPIPPPPHRVSAGYQSAMPFPLLPWSNRVPTFNPHYLNPMNPIPFSLGSPFFPNVAAFQQPTSQVLKPEPDTTRAILSPPMHALYDFYSGKNYRDV